MSSRPWCASRGPLAPEALRGGSGAVAVARRRPFAIRGATALWIALVLAAALACERVDPEAPTPGPRDPAAQYRWGRQYLYGVDLPKNETLAAHWFRKAAEGGHAAAQFELSMLCAKGIGVPENQTEATRWLREAAEQGHPKAAWKMSRRYAEGRGVPKSDTDEVAWVRRAADLGNLQAMFSLGSRHREGTGVHRDAGRAHMWFNLARALGGAEATPLLSRLEAKLTPERIAEAQRLAREWWAEHRAPAADPPATAADRFELGMAYATGKGVPQDDVYALEWLRKAAEGGHARAQREFAERLAAGRGAPADEAQAASWLRRAEARERDTPEPWLFEILDERGHLTPVRVSLWDEVGRSIEPRGLRSYVDPFDVRYFYVDGRFQISGEHPTVRIRVQKGFEYRVVDERLDRADGPAQLRLERVFDMRKRGYYSGDGHLHPNFGPPRFPVGNRTLLEWMKAEDLNVANLLATNLWEARIFLADRITGKIEPESEPDFILQFSEEYRSAVYGHMSVYGVRQLSDPLFTSFRNTPNPYDFPTNYEAARKYADAGAFPIYAHLRPPADFAAPGGIPAYAAECPADVALGVLNAVEIQGYSVITKVARPIWERLMSAGFDVVVTAGTDAYPGQPKTGVMGFARSYVDMGNRPLSYQAWSARLAQGRGFTSNGPLVFLSVDGKAPGDTLSLEPGETRSVEVEVVVDSVFPWNRVSVRSNHENALVFRCLSLERDAPAPPDVPRPPHVERSGLDLRPGVRWSGPRGDSRRRQAFSPGRGHYQCHLGDARRREAPPRREPRVLHPLGGGQPRRVGGAQQLRFPRKPRDRAQDVPARAGDLRAAPGGSPRVRVRPCSGHCARVG